jgi:AcrR family transcriptional regulator
MSENDTARAIQHAARHLLDEGGAEAVSMRKVAQRVGVTAMAIYRHFPDHAALMNAVAEQGFAELAARMRKLELGPGGVEGLTRAGDAFVDYALEQPRLFELMFLTKRRGARRFPRDFEAGLSPTANLFAAAFGQGVRSGEFADADPWEVTFEIGALIQGLAMLHLGGRFEGGPEEFRLFCRRAVWRYIHGIRA